MADTRKSWSRRAAIGVMLQSASGALVMRIAPARANDKMTRAQAEYQDAPNGIYSCAICSLFEAPSACKVVEGDVSKDGWCRAFALQD